MWIQLFIISFIIMLIPIESSLLTEMEKDEASLRSCMCADYKCSCCTHIEIDKMKVNGTLCSDMKYLPNDIGISLTVTYNKITIFNETISVRNPPAICPIMVHDLHIEACIRFHDVDFNRHHFDGCAEVEISFIRAFPLLKKELGCFHMGFKTSINSIPNVILIKK